MDKAKRPVSKEAGRFAKINIMQTQFILSEYIDRAMNEAEYDKLEDASFAGNIPACVGVIAFDSTLRGCENELRSTLEDWLLLGLKLGHALPEIGCFSSGKDWRKKALFPQKR